MMSSGDGAEGYVFEPNELDGSPRVDSHTQWNHPVYVNAEEDIRRITKGRGVVNAFFLFSAWFIQRGAYTYCEVWVRNANSNTNSRLKGVGFSKSRPTDKYDEWIGKNIAMKRALEDALS
jgi:hypothetical protein